MFKRLALLAAVSVAAIVAPANAATIYNNGGPTPTDGNESAAWVQAESFTLTAASLVGSAGVYMSAFGGGGYNNSGFQYYIFANSAGTPGAVLTTGSVTPTITNAGLNDAAGSPVKLFSFNFATPFAAAANTTYFFGIHANAAGNFTRTDIYWDKAAGNGTPTGRESAGGTFNNWSDNGNEHAFFLGDAVGGAVPEPATWAMMLAGFGLTGAALRRRRQQATVTFA